LRFSICIHSTKTKGAVRGQRSSAKAKNERTGLEKLLDSSNGFCEECKNVLAGVGEGKETIKRGVRNNLIGE
jgi:hypothetical protein